MSLYIDLSEFLAVPMKTGIQRIGGEICRYLPPGFAVPVRLHADRLVALPPALIESIGRYFRDGGESGTAEIRRLGAFENGSPVTISSSDTVLVPEIFGEQRAAFFRSMPERERQRCRFIVYDLLPFTHPEFFPPAMPAAMSGYFQIVRWASNCGFISEHTRDTYFGRLRRTAASDGVVLPLGCDSLGAKPSRLTLDRPLAFCVLGTIEPRKNHELILDVFEPMLREIDGLSLSFIGKLGWVNSHLSRRVQTLSSNPKSGFQFHSVLSDEAIRSHIEKSRATIYVSTAEGYGLPPVESLWLGTPVIASAAIPSLERLGSAGIHYLDALDAASLKRAVLAFVDTRYANRKIEETAQLNLPTWRSFTEEVVQWCAPGATA